MIKLLIPTRNRPSSLKALLSYLENFYPHTDLIVADGSHERYKADVKNTCDQYSQSLSIEFRSYPAELPFFERILDALLSCEDDIVAMGADDDYPIMDTLNQAKAILLSGTEFKSIVPADIVLTLSANGDLTSRLSYSRDVLHANPINRLKDYSYWHFATTYAVTRKAALLNRYRMMSQHNCASFVDFQIGVEDAIHGGIKAMPEIGYIRTQTYAHEYFRAIDSLIFLRKSEKILAYRDYLVEQLSRLPSSVVDDARKLADLIVSRRICDLTGGSAPSKLNFTATKQFRDPTLQQQFKNFYELFENGTKLRETYLAKLVFARDVLLSDVASSENAGPAGNYENI